MPLPSCAVTQVCHCPVVLSPRCAVTQVCRCLVVLSPRCAIAQLCCRPVVLSPRCAVLTVPKLLCQVEGHHALGQQRNGETIPFPTWLWIVFYYLSGKRENIVKTWFPWKSKNLEVISCLLLWKWFKELFTMRCQAKVKRMRESYMNAKKTNPLRRAIR